MMSSGRTSCAWLANRMFSQPSLVLDRRGELNVPDDMAKGMADALEAALHSPGEAGVLERDTVEACIRILRRGSVKLERTPPGARHRHCGGGCETPQEAPEPTTRPWWRRMFGS
jgi:hypothetical protein